MPVTINGNGSITGLSVGGLPNGTVDADTLASNAVTTVKIADGAATATKVGAGSVIQTVNQQVAGGSMTNVSSSATTYTGLFAEITPHLANSKILVLVQLRAYIHSGGLDTGVSFTIQRKIGSGSYSVLEGSVDAINSQQFYIYNPTSGSEFSCTFSDTVYDSPGTNSEVVRYQIFASANSGGTLTLNSGTANHFITLMEIKQ